MRRAAHPNHPHGRQPGSGDRAALASACTLVYPAALGRQVMTRWRHWTRGLTEQVSTSVVLVDVVTPLPGVPAAAGERPAGAPVAGESPTGGPAAGPPVLPEGSYVIVRIRWPADGVRGQAAARAGVRGWRRWHRPLLELPGDGGYPGDEFALATVDCLVLAAFPAAGDLVLAGLPPYRSARYAPDRLAG